MQGWPNHCPGFARFQAPAAGMDGWGARGRGSNGWLDEHCCTSCVADVNLRFEMRQLSCDFWVAIGRASPIRPPTPSSQRCRTETPHATRCQHLQTCAFHPKCCRLEGTAMLVLSVQGCPSDSEPPLVAIMEVSDLREQPGACLPTLGRLIASAALPRALGLR